MFRFVFFMFFTFLAFSARAEVIAFTHGDLEVYKNLESGQKLSFLVEFYQKNKAAGATDGEILNEIIKIDEIQSDPILKTFSKVSSKVKDFEGYFRLAVDDMNRQIAETNPGRQDLLIDPNDSSTWKNLQYMTIGDKSIKEYIDGFSKDKFFSTPAYTKTGAVMLASCARIKENNPNVLMGVMVLLNKSSVILQQKEGEVKTPLTIDFSGSENVTLGNPSYPLQDDLPAFGGVGYVKEAILPFTAEIKDLSKPATVKAVVSAVVCRDGVCVEEKFPSVDFEILSSYLESSVCTQLEQAKYNAPANQNAKIKLKEAVFKKEKDGTDLIVMIEKPFFITDLPKLQIANEEGLHFQTPFMSGEGSKVFYKARLKNPQLLENKKEVPLTLTFSSGQKSSEINRTVKIGDSFFSGFTTSIIGCFTAFISGIKFIVLTPLLTALLLLMYQMFNARGRSAEKTGAFFDGLVKSTWFLIPFYVFFIALFSLLPGRSLFWGIQFMSPWLNFVYLSLFIIMIAAGSKMDDDSFVARISKPFKVFFIRFDIEEDREKAGFIVGLICGLLLLISPEIAMYYGIYTQLMKSPFLYPLFFMAAIAVAFIAVVLLDQKAEEEGEPVKFLKAAFLLPLILQAVLLFILIGSESGLLRMGAVLLLIGGGFAALRKVGRKLAAVAVLILSIALVPLVPNDYDVNKYGARDFNEDELNIAVRQGKTVYLNVTESACLICQVNRLMMIYRGGAAEIKQGKLMIMGIPYSHPFLRRLLEGTDQYVLPANLIFSPKTPSGKILPSILGPWGAPEVVQEYVIP